MKIVTTPMCEDIVKYAGITDYVVNRFPKKEDGDLAILLSESKTDMKSVRIKINTFSQIRESVEKISKYGCGTNMDSVFEDYPLAAKYLNHTPQNTTRVKVYSNFLKDIAEDMGFEIVDENYDLAIAPDYLVDEIDEDVLSIPSHNNVSKNPIKKASLRYEILEDYINYK